MATQQTLPGIDPQDAETINWLFGWFIIIAAGLLISKSKAGYAAIYYGLVLLVMLLAVTQSGFILSEVVLATTEGVPNSYKGGQGGSDTCKGNGSFCKTSQGFDGICENGTCKILTPVENSAILSQNNALGAAGIITV